MAVIVLFWIVLALCLLSTSSSFIVEEVEQLYRSGSNEKYQDSSYPDDTAGTFFSGVFTDNTVLQRDAKAAVYGVVIGATPSTSVTIVVKEGNISNNSSNMYDGYTFSYERKASTKVTQRKTVAGGVYATWKVFLREEIAGNRYSLSISCKNCISTRSSTIKNVVFGDVWFCSGQSNMVLPMHFTTSRNVTYDKILRDGRYKNIRMYTTNHNNQPDFGYNNTDLYILPPPPPRNPWGDYAAGGWLLPDVGSYANESCREGLGDSGCTDPTHCCTRFKQPNDDWLYNSVDQFSATCWHFAEYLTDAMHASNETIDTIGLITSAWGGTMIEHWQPNATLNAGTCKNSSGGDYAPWQNKRWDIDSGGLYNGMVLPFINMTIKGALWYQGENNVFQCHDAEDKDQSKGGWKPGGGPFACGDENKSTGYSCMIRNLINTWRKAWSIEPQTTPQNFPFGIVSLAGGTSEGHGNNMGAFRYAQTGNTGYLPNEAMPNTFVAQAYDAGDPCSGGGYCCVNSGGHGGGWSCMAGDAPYTQQFMGSIHPRVKKIVGTRLAKAARAIVYGDTKEIWTGPVLKSCSHVDNRITLKFEREYLKDDAIMVLDQTTKGISVTNELDILWDSNMLKFLQQLGPGSPMEIQLNGNHDSEDKMTSGIWVPVQLEAKCSPNGADHPEPGKNCCNWNYTTSSRQNGWDEVHVKLDDISPSLRNNITGIRYAWSDNPCCPGINRMVMPCPPNSCPIQTFNSTMPAVPFWATINKDGICDWISTTNTHDGVINEDTSFHQDYDEKENLIVSAIA